MQKSALFYKDTFIVTKAIYKEKSPVNLHNLQKLFQCLLQHQLIRSDKVTMWIPTCILTSETVYSLGLWVLSNKDDPSPLIKIFHHTHNFITIYFNVLQFISTSLKTSMFFMFIMKITKCKKETSFYPSLESGCS